MRERTGRGFVRARRRDAGMVTAELAAALPVLVLLVGVALAAEGVAQARVRCVDAAREAARAIARGESAATAQGLADAAAGRTVNLRTSGLDSGLQRVTASLQLRPVSWMGPISIVESAVAASESEGP